MPVKKKILIVIAIFLVVSTSFLIAARKWTDTYLATKIHAEIIRAVENRFDGRAELQNVHITLSLRPQITGNKLNIWTSKKF